MFLNFMKINVIKNVRSNHVINCLYIVMLYLYNNLKDLSFRPAKVLNFQILKKSVSSSSVVAIIGILRTVILRKWLF